MRPRNRPSSFSQLMLAAVLLVGGGEPAWAGKLFTGPINSSAGRQPYALAPGDFNRDGIIDLAVTNDNPSDDDAVKILLGKGDGTFQVPVSYRVGSGPFSVVASDFNEDDNLDLVVVNESAQPGSGRLSLLLGNGDGTFQRQAKYSNGAKQAPLRGAVGDFNRDGNLDLAVTNGQGFGKPGFVSVLLGDGDGSFQLPMKIAAGESPGLIAAGDLNWDGWLDIVVADRCGCPNFGTNALLNNGDGTFRPISSFKNATQPVAIVLGDFNGDGKLDLAETYGADNVAIRLGNGDGTFQEAVHSSTGGGAGAIALADFDSDGNLDIAVLTSVGADSFVTLLQGKGNGFFRPPLSYPLNPVASPIQIVAADLDGDGRLDVAVTDYFNRCVSVFLNTGGR